MARSYTAAMTPHSEFHTNWEMLIDALKEGRKLTNQELDCAEEETIKMALKHDLCDPERGERALLNIYDAWREEAWYDT